MAKVMLQSCRGRLLGVSWGRLGGVFGASFDENCMQDRWKNDAKTMKTQRKKRSKNYEKTIKTDEEINEKSMKHQSKIDQKSTKNRSWGRLGVSWGRLGVRMGASSVRAGHLWPSWEHLGPSWAEKVANMAASWLPKRSQDGPKIHQNFDHFLDASWDRFLNEFWSIFGSKMEASWHQNRSKIDVNFERRFFEKSCSPCSGGSIFQDSGVQVGSKNRSKIDQKMESKMECLLASIFHRFWWILEAKLSQVGMENRAKIDQKAHGKYDEKKKASWRRLGGVLGA